MSILDRLRQTMTMRKRDLAPPCEECGGIFHTTLECGASAEMVAHHDAVSVVDAEGITDLFQRQKRYDELVGRTSA